MKIYAPVKHFNGIRNSVKFVGGVGETDDQRRIEWFRNNGYIIEANDDEKLVFGVTEVEVLDDDALLDQLVETSVETPVEPVKEKTFEEMTPNELRQWMTENGFGSKIRNTRNKQKLLEILRGND